MTTSFYADFEKSFRGSQAEIKNRLKTYLPFVTPFLHHSGPRTAIDLGCGRGEWLDLMRDTGIDAKGVDLDAGMLAEARSLGLAVIQQDALKALAALPANSQALVTGFHIAEHLDFEVLKEVVREAHRVLCPGGLLILETPNPENMAVATNYFYIDPTHVRPLPPDLLAFLPKYFNFQRTKIVRLQEDPNLLAFPIQTIAQVLKGASPDYAVIAQKQADQAVLMHWDAIFEKPFGITMETLSDRYYEHLQARDAAYQEQLQARDAAYQEQVNFWHQRYIEVIGSRSWRITAPLRSAKIFFEKLKKIFN